MDSRPVVPQQQRGEAAVAGAGKQKVVKPGVANRRVLGDIGNQQQHQQPQQEQQFNRPITRSFCAQLLANAQAAAVENNIKKKQVPFVADRALVAKPAPPLQKKVVVKPQPEEVIVISPDTAEITLEDKPEIRKASPRGSHKKKVHSLTAILTARSKAACGITNKPKELVVDIDAADADNHLAAVEYVEDIYKFYKLEEGTSMVHDYMDSQPEVNEKMRAILVDWLIEVHKKFELMPESLYLTINIVDRYLSMKTVPRRELQLVGMSAMLIASKYEEIWAPEVNDFVSISDSAYTREQVLVMEKKILGRIEWTLTVPTPYVFLVRFTKAAVSDQEIENMVFFLGELALMHYATIKYCPSMIAASAVYVARCTLNKSPVWTETLKLHTGFSEPQLMDCAKLLVKFHMGAPEHSLKVIYRKYSNSQRNAVALLSPAKSLLA